MNYIAAIDTDTAEPTSAIKLHGPEAFEGMRKAGRLAAEVLDMLVPHVKPGVTTGEIDSFERDAIRLKSGAAVPADLVVTATGLRLSLGGKIAVSLDGRAVDFSERWFYRGAMFSNVPNLAIVFGYLNASWTLRADNTADYVCRVLKRLHALRADLVVPHLPEDHGLEVTEPFPFSSGYLQRARGMVPKSAAALPWRLNQNYLEDCRDCRKRPVEDGVLRCEKRPAASEAA